MARKITNFFDRLRHEQERKKSIVCVGIGPDLEEIQKRDVPIPYGRKASQVLAHRIVRETREYVPVFKFSLASFSVEGDEDYLKGLIQITKDTFQSLTILDAKYSNTGNAVKRHAEEAFIYYGADAVTVNPYFGIDTVEPYLEHKGKGVIVVIRTTNPGSSDYQTIVTENGLRLYEKMALDMAALNDKYGGDRIGLFAGTTSPVEIARIRELVGDMPLLIPRIGEKGSNLKDIVQSGVTSDGFGLMACVRTDIIYSKNPEEAVHAIQKQTNLCRHAT